MSGKVGRPPIADEEAVLAAALKAFAAFGFEGTSVRVLNRELGISHNAIHQRFGSKERLWYAAADFGFKRLQAALLGPLSVLAESWSDDAAGLRALVNCFLRASAEQPDLLRLMNQEGALDTPRLQHIFVNYVEPPLLGAHHALKRLQASGRVRPISLRSFVFLLAHGAGAPFTMRGYASKFDEVDGPFDVEHHIEWMTEFFMRGLLIADVGGDAPQPVDSPNGAPQPIDSASGP